MFDSAPAAAEALGRDVGAPALGDLDALLTLAPDVVVVAVTHDHLC